MPLYFVAIVAPEHINNQVNEWKHYMHEHYGCKVAMRSPAHITLVPPFNMDSSREKDLLQALKHLGSQHPVFEIALNNFAAFKPRVIYVDVVMSRELENIKRSVEDFLDAAAFPIKKESRPFHPHVTLANRDLQKEDFYEAWQHFQSMKYKASFMAEEISLLRSEHDGWRVVENGE